MPAFVPTALSCPPAPGAWLSITRCRQPIWPTGFLSGPLQPALSTPLPYGGTVQPVQHLFTQSQQ